jgi:hypothetical protein
LNGINNSDAAIQESMLNALQQVLQRAGKGVSIESLKQIGTKLSEFLSSDDEHLRRFSVSYYSFSLISFSFFFFLSFFLLLFHFSLPFCFFVYDRLPLLVLTASTFNRKNCRHCWNRF